MLLWAIAVGELAGLVGGAFHATLEALGELRARFDNGAMGPVEPSIGRAAAQQRADGRRLPARWPSPF